MFGFWWRRKHNRLRGLLSAYSDAEVSDAEAREVEAHLSECEDCRLELAELRSTVGLLRALPQFAVPRSFALRESPVSTRRTPPIVWTARLSTSAAGLLLVALLLGDALGIVRQTPRSAGSLADVATQAAPAAVEMEAMAAAAAQVAPTAAQMEAMAATAPQATPQPEATAAAAQAAPTAAQMEAMAATAPQAAPQPEVMAAAATAAPQAAPQPEVMAAAATAAPQATPQPEAMAAAAQAAPTAAQMETMATAVPAALPTAMPEMIATAAAPALAARSLPQAETMAAAALPTETPAMIAPAAPAALPTEAYAMMADADAPTPAAQPARAEEEEASGLLAEESIDEAPTATMRLPEAAPESGVAEEENTDKGTGGIVLPLRELQIGVGALLVVLVAASVWLARRRSGWLVGGRKCPRP